MYRNVTAVYRTYAVADLVRKELHDLGIQSGHVRMVPDSDLGTAAGGTDRDDRYDRHVDALHDLHLPEDDVRTYQNCVRRGDYVVSAEVDEDQVTRVQQIMRRPEDEAYNLDTRADEFSDEFVRAAPRRTARGRGLDRDPGRGPDRPLLADLSARQAPRHKILTPTGWTRKGVSKCPTTGIPR